MSLIMKDHPLPYLTACIRESQRLQPIAPLLKRQLEADLEEGGGGLGGGGGLADHSGGGGRVLRAGTKVLIPIFLLHRDALVYPEPEAFRPDRWLAHCSQLGVTDREATTIPQAFKSNFYPFGGGAKVCVGFQLAEKELKMAALALVACYNIASAGPMVIEDHFVTGPANVYVTLMKRGSLLR